jgi:hypothetical protein
MNDAALFERATGAASRFIDAWFDRRQQGQRQEDEAGGAGGQEGGGPGAEAAAAAAVVRLAWACATAQHIDAPFLGRALAWLAAAGPGAGLGPAQLARLYDVQCALTDAAACARPELLGMSPPHGLLHDAHEAWLARRAAGRGAPGRAPRAFQAEVHEALGRLGLPAALEVPTACGMHVVDVLVRARGAASRAPGAPPRAAGTPRLAITLDGPGAFAANAPGAALGETAARWRALQARGLRVRRAPGGVPQGLLSASSPHFTCSPLNPHHPTPTPSPRPFQVVSLRWSDWARLPDAAAKQAFLWDALRGTLRGDGGAEAAGWPRRAAAEAAAAAAAPKAANPASRWWRAFLDGGGG